MDGRRIVKSFIAQWGGGCQVQNITVGFNDIKFEGHEGHHVLYFLNAMGSRISNMTFLCVMKVMKTTFTFKFTFTFTFTLHSHTPT